MGRTRKSWFPVGQSHDRNQESGRVGEISNMFDQTVSTWLDNRGATLTLVANFIF